MEGLLYMIGVVAYHNGEYWPEDVYEDNFLGDAVFKFKTKDLLFYYSPGFDGTKFAKVHYYGFDGTKILKDDADILLVYQGGDNGGTDRGTAVVYERGDLLSKFLKKENWEKVLEELYNQTLERVDNNTCHCEACSKWLSLISE